MRQEVIDFFADNGTPIDKMIHIGFIRRRLDPESIRNAAESVYDDLQKGIPLDKNRLAWEVFARSTPAIEKEDSIAELKESVKKLHDKIDYHIMTPWYKKIWRKK